MPKESSRQFDKYDIDRKLGSGGFGDVYLATHLALKKQVAIKVLKPLIAGDPGLIARFRLEAEKAAGLEHPNIAAIYDFGETEGRNFIVMEYVEGQPLDKLLAAGRIAPARILHILEQVASALDYAHAKGLTHRDVKPANILVGYDEATKDPDRTRLVDFGLVRATDASIISSIGQGLGTPSYMAPEQFDATFGSVGPASDIYSLGVVAYEMFAGKPPFEGSITQIMYAHCNSQPARIDTTDSELPPGLWQALAPALAKHSCDRPETAGALVAALRAAYEPALPARMPFVQEVPPQRGPAQPEATKPPVAAQQPAGALPSSHPEIETSVRQSPATASARARSVKWLWPALFIVAAMLIALAIIQPWRPPQPEVRQAALTASVSQTPAPPTARVVKETVVVEKTVVVEQTVDRAVAQTVVVEKPVERTVIVEKPVVKTVVVPVERVVVVTAAPTRRVIFTDDFVKAQHWNHFSDQYGSAKYADGGYVLVAAKTTIWHDVLPGRTFSEGAVEVDATPLTSTSVTGVGITLAWQYDRTMYIFGVEPNGCSLNSYNKDKYDQPNSWWVPLCPRLEQDHTYRLRVDVDKTTVRGYVDGNLVAEFERPDYAPGKIGLAVFNGSDASQTTNTSARFDNFAIYQ